MHVEQCRYIRARFAPLSDDTRFMYCTAAGVTSCLFLLKYVATP